MNLNQLRIFYESAKELNFSIAAKHLFISQPAVSAQMKQLEDMLKIKLFNKVGKHIYLTEPGKILLSYANRIFELEEEAERTLNEMKELKRGTLHIGTTRTYARYLMPNYLSIFHSIYPEVKISLSEGSSLEIVQSLFNLKNELAIVARTNYPKTLNTISFSQEEIILVASPENDLAKMGSVTVEELSKIPLIMREEGSGTRTVVVEMFKKNSLSPTVLYEASNLECIKELLIRGEGASFIVRSAVNKELSAGQLAEIQVQGTSLLMESNVVFINKDTLSRAALAFLNCLFTKKDGFIQTFL